MPWGQVQWEVFGAGVFGGLLLALILLVQFDRFRGPLIWSGIGVTCLAVIGLVGAVSREISFTQAIVTVAFAGAALVAAAYAIHQFAKGDGIELQSHWGGLGGALGGWRLSPVTSLLVLALVFAGGALAVSVTSKGGAGDRKKTIVEAKDAGKTPVPSAAKQPAAAGGSAAEAPGGKQEIKEEKK